MPLGTSSKKAGNAQGGTGLNTAPHEFVKLIRAQTPRLIEIGKPRPKLVLSFGGAGWLFTYGLGVAEFLSREYKQLLNETYFLGSGSGVIPATALSLGITDMHKVKDLLLTKENLFNVMDGGASEMRNKLVDLVAEKYLPPRADALMNGKVTLALGMTQSDRGFKMQEPDMMIHGHHISMFDDNPDIASCLKAAMVCNKYDPATFRYGDKKVARATSVAHCSQLDQAIRHVYVKGLSGNPSTRRAQRHNHIFGVHGSLVNTHHHWIKQYQFACLPTAVGGRAASLDALNESFDNGYQDARRYERWLEDSYHFAQADRSLETKGDMRNLRAMWWIGWDR